MKLSILLFISLSVTLVESIEACERHESCKTFDRTSGTVKSVNDCEFFLKLRRTERSQHRPCGYVGLLPLICCPPSKTIRTRFTRKVVEQCDKFRKSRASDDSMEIVEKIINGRDCDVGEFPHFASLGYLNNENGEYTFGCGGALISANFVLTAAHCCKLSHIPNIVRLGKTAADIYNQNDPYEHKDVEVKDVIPHPDYQPRYKHHDIALLKLSHSIQFKPNIHPACLYPDEDYQNNNLIIAGFGRNDLKDESKRATWLQKAEVEEIPLSECSSNYEEIYGNFSIKGLNQGITNDLLCAKNRRKHVDTCEGDSGSALQFFMDDTYMIVGVTSFGVSCNTSLPSFYTRVLNYLDWIEETVWPN